MQDKWWIRKFIHNEDLKIINSWLRKRNLPTVPLRDLPEFGFVSCKDGKEIGMAFLRRCEGGLCIFDSMITNPKESLFTRHLSIEMLIDKIKEKASELGNHKIIAFSIDNGTIKRSKKHGFKEQKHVVLSLAL